MCVIAEMASDISFQTDCGDVVQKSCTYEWTLSNCTDHCRHPKKMIISPNFSSGKNSEYTWRLILYPAIGDERDYLALVLQSLNNFSVRVKLNCYYSIKCIKSIRVERSDELSVAKFIKVIELIEIDNLMKCLKNSEDSLTIICEIKVSTGDLVDSISNNHAQLGILNDFESLLENKEYCDVTLVANGKKFRAHKAILAARSIVFSAMFKHDMKERNENLVEIGDVDHEVLKELLRYIYVGRVENAELVKDLLVAANKYALLGLKDICAEHLCRMINSDNASELLALADLNDAKSLQVKAENFIVTHAKDIIHTPGFKSLGNAHPRIMMELFRKLTLKSN